jgi:hypothetical protein
MFVQYDTEKKGVTLDQLKEIMVRLLKDECIIGKIPDLNEEEIDQIFEPWEISDEKKCEWHLLRDGLNTWQWRLQDRETL